MKFILAAAFATGMSTAALAQTIDGGSVISLDDWAYDDLYAGGWSADEFIDEMDVVGPTGEDIGDVEDIVVGGSGQILSVIVEVGGFIDIGDTHASVPWDQVSVQGDTVVVPLTEENLEDYDVFDYAGLQGGQLSDEIVRGVDDLEAGARAWRVSELIGDYARIRNADTYSNYGYVSDLIMRDGAIAATVIEPTVGYGGGYYAYPYYGYGGGYGWEPGSPYYDLPYTQDQVGALDAFDYNRFAM